MRSSLNESLPGNEIITGWAGNTKATFVSFFNMHSVAGLGIWMDGTDIWIWSLGMIPLIACMYVCTELYSMSGERKYT